MFDPELIQYFIKKIFYVIKKDEKRNRSNKNQWIT